MTFKIGLIGCGAIGRALAMEIAGERRCELVAVFDVDKGAAGKLGKSLHGSIAIAESFDEFIGYYGMDLVIEAASADVISEHGRTILERSDLMVMSAAAFLIYPGLYEALREEAMRHDRKIYVPSGALVGLDGVKSAAADGTITEVLLTTTKHPRGIEQTEWLTGRGIDLGAMKERTVIFEGPAAEAARLFPKNLNVAATLALAGIGADNKTRVRLVADPGAGRNTHKLIVKGGFGEFETVTRNVPSPANPRTSYLAALSAIATLRAVIDQVRVGT